jgi:hypothetical protein
MISNKKTQNYKIADLIEGLFFILKSSLSEVVLKIYDFFYGGALR